MQKSPSLSKASQRWSTTPRSFESAMRQPRGYLAWCLEGGGKLVAAFRSNSDRARVRLVLTDARQFDARRAGPGMGRRTARRRLRAERRFGRGVLALCLRRQRPLFGVARRRVTFLAVARPRLSRRVARRYLRRAP